MSFFATPNKLRSRSNYVPAVKKIYGGPGTGKTTTLIGHVEDELIRGLRINEIAYLGFTRASCFEALGRIQKSMNTKKSFWFQTIHSACYRLLKMTGQYPKINIAGFRHKRSFCLRNKLEMPERESEYVGGASVSEGEAFFSTLSYLVNTFRTVEEWKSCQFSEALGERDFIELYNSWIKFKSLNKLMDFSDMLLDARERHINIPTKVLFVDEFQDLSPLQVSIIQQFMKGKEGVYIAGDDDQALYRFQGAEPEIMLEFRSDVDVVLDHSYRVPQSILPCALRFIGQNSRRKTKDISPKGEVGSLKILRSPATFRILNAIDEQSTFFLLRTNWLVNKLTWVLAEEGILFNYLDKRKNLYLGWTEKKTHIINEAIKIRVRDRKNYLRSLVNKGEISMNATFFLEKYLYRNKPINPDDITAFIGTIHSAKGQEANSIILFDDITWKIADAMDVDKRGISEVIETLEDERRVWYVGMTRTKKNLLIVNNYFFDTPTFDLPQHLMRGRGDW